MPSLPDVIKLNDTHYLVRSEKDFTKKYHVTKRGDYWYCNCAKFLFGKEQCKHIEKINASRLRVVKARPSTCGQQVLHQNGGLALRKKEMRSRYEEIKFRK